MSTTIDVVQNITPSEQFVAAAGQTVYPYPFPIIENSDIVVDVNGAPTGAFTVTGAGNDTGGTVTLNTPSTVGDIVTIYRNIPIQRVTQYQQNGPFTSAAINAEFNDVYLIMQQLGYSQGLSLSLPITNNPAPTTVLTPANYANKYLSFDSNGNPIPAALTASGVVTAALIGSLLYAIVPQETSASVTPSTLVYPVLDPRRYGVDISGVADSSAAFANWHAVAAQFGSVILHNAAQGIIRADLGVTIDSNKVGIDLNGGKFDFSHMTTGHAITIIQSNSNVNARPLLNSSHPISNGYLQGPGVAITAVDCLYLNDSALSTVAGGTFRNLSFTDFAVDVTLGVGAYCCIFSECLFTQLTGSAATTYSLNVLSTNNGERNVFDNCWWYNKAYGINQQSGQSDTYFKNCSADVFTRFFSSVGGLIVADKMHIESGADTDFWGVCAAGATLVLNSPTIVTHANKTAFDMFSSQAGSTNSGIFIDMPVFETGSFTVGTRIIGGTSTALGQTGNSWVRRPIFLANTSRPTMSAFTSKLAYGDMESANWAGDWTLSGSTIPTQSTAQAHAGTKSMLLSPTSSNTPGATMKRACAPGQYLQGEFYYMALALTGTGCTFGVSLSYQDAAGVQITGVSSVAVTTTTSSWTKSGFSALTPAPPGTVTAALIFGGTGTTSGTPLIYIDDIIANIE